MVAYKDLPKTILTHFLWALINDIVDNRILMSTEKNNDIFGKKQEEINAKGN